MVEGVSVSNDTVSRTLTITFPGGSVEIPYEEIPSPPDGLFDAILDLDSCTLSRTIASALHTDALRDMERLESGWVDNAKDKLRAQVAGVNNALLDFTTYNVALELLEPSSSYTAFSLFDLNIFVTASILFDRVYVVYPNIDVDGLNRRLGDKAFACLDLDEEADRLLFDMWMNLISTLERKLPRADVECLAWCWERLLGVPQSKISFSWSSAETWKYSPAPSNGIHFYATYQRPLADLQSTENEEELIEFISLSTFRTFHNHQLSRLLGATYLPNSVRGPIEGYILDGIERERSAFDYLLARYNERISKSVDGWKAQEPRFAEKIRVRLPMFLAVLFNRLGDRELDADGFLSEVGSLRRDATGYRKAIPKYLESLERADISAYQDARQEIERSAEEMSKQYGSDVNSVIVGALNVPFLPPEIKALKVALKAFIALMDPVKHGTRLYWRLRKPHLYFLVERQKEAQHFLSVRHAIRKFWREPSRFDYELFERVLRYYPYSL